MRKNCFSIAAFLVVAFLFFGCDAFLDSGSVEFSLPEWDSSFGVELEYWLVKISDGSGERTVFAGNVSRFVTVEVDFERVSAVLAYPVSSVDVEGDSFFFKPAGCVYPYQTGLSYMQGFTSEILREFYAYHAHYQAEKVSTLAKKFNWEKFSRCIEEKCSEFDGTSMDKEEFFYNPWNCDHDKIFLGIQNNSFSTSYLNQAKSNLTSITLDDLRALENGEGLFPCESLLSSYVPENFFEGEFVLPYNKQREFISLDGEFIREIFVNFLKKEGKIVLAINSIPL